MNSSPEEGAWGEATKWYQNKVLSGIAEASCRAHFEALDYHVENFGIEHIAPLYCSQRDHTDWGYYIKGYHSELQHMPDFLISKIFPASGGKGRRIKDAIFVDAKYRDKFEGVYGEDEFSSAYEKQILGGMPILIYLVSRDFTQIDSRGNKTRHTGNCHVFLKFLHSSGGSRIKPETRWFSAHDPKLPDWTLYQGSADPKQRHFGSAYRELIHPALEKIFGSNRAEP